MRGRVKSLALVCAVSLAARLVKVFALPEWLAGNAAPLVSHDAIFYHQQALFLQHGAWASFEAACRFHAFHPLTALVLSALPPRGAVLVSLLPGLALAPLCWALFRRMGMGGGATIAALFVAAHPLLTALSADVLSDSLFLGLSIATLYALWRLGGCPSWTWAALAGLGAGLGYLTRPEALAPFGAGLCWVIAKTRKARVLAALLVCGLVMAPYALHLAQRGYLLSAKWHLLRTLPHSRDDPPPSEAEARYRRALEADPGDPPRFLLLPEAGAEIPSSLGARFSDLGRELLGKGFFYLLAPLVLWGVLISCLKARRTELAAWNAGASAFLALQIGVQGALLLALVLAKGYVSGRHVLLVALLFLPWAARALEDLARRLCAALSARYHAFPHTRVLAVLGGICAATLLGGAWNASSGRRVPLRDAGQAIAVDSARRFGPGHHPVLLVEAPAARSAYYASSEPGLLYLRDDFDAATLERHLRVYQVEYVVAFESSPRPWRGSPALAAPERFPPRSASRQGPVLVYRVRGASPNPAAP